MLLAGNLYVSTQMSAIFLTPKYCWKTFSKLATNLRDRANFVFVFLLSKVHSRLSFLMWKWGESLAQIMFKTDKQNGVQIEIREQK